MNATTETIAPADANSDAAAPALRVLVLDIYMDSHRVRGELRYTGVGRRLVDILNSIEAGGHLALHNGRLEPLGREEPDSRVFGRLQVRREAIILAVPSGDIPASPQPMEAVHKAPFPVTFVVPGYELSGNAYLLPDADPALAPFLGSRHFIPMTDVTITAAQQGAPPREEPILLVNLARTLFYAPR